MKPETQNDAWQQRVRFHLSQGLGVEDIALKLRADVESVRREVDILRETGALAMMFGGEA